MDPSARDDFNKDTVVFECFAGQANASSCQAADNHDGPLTPANAFACASGYKGALCASCVDGYYFSDNECLRCGDTALPPSVKAALALLITGVVLLIAYKCFARHHAKTIMPKLHWLRRKLQRQKRRRRRRQRQRWGQQREPERRGAIKLRIQDRIQGTMIRAVHASVSAARNRIGVGGEDFRILLNAAKIISNLYSTLNWCLSWPAAMQHLTRMCSFLTFDLLTATQSPCWITGFSYYTRVEVALAAPIAITVGAVLVGVLLVKVEGHNLTRNKRRGRNTVVLADLESRLETVQRRVSKHCPLLTAGMWRAAFALLFILDLIFPMLTKILLQFFSCRNLENAKWWLEARQDFAEHFFPD